MAAIQNMEITREVFPAPKGGFHGPCVEVDNDNNWHEVVVYQAGTNTDDSTTIRYTKRAGTYNGPVIDQATYRLPNDLQGRPGKVDDLGAVKVLIPPGSGLGSLMVPYVAHGANDANNSSRYSPWGVFLIPDVYAPHARGVNPNELFDVPLPVASEPPPPPPPGGGGGLTQADIDAIMAGINHLFGASSNDARTGVHDKSKQGTVEVVNERRLLTEALFAAGGSYPVWQQLINTAYTGCMGALHDAGLIKTDGSSQASATVHESLQAALVAVEALKTQLEAQLSK